MHRATGIWTSSRLTFSDAGIRRQERHLACVIAKGRIQHGPCTPISVRVAEGRLPVSCFLTLHGPVWPAFANARPLCIPLQVHPLVLRGSLHLEGTLKGNTSIGRSGTLAFSYVRTYVYIHICRNSTGYR